MDFVCPICKGELTADENRIKRCPRGHSFDRAKQGYYNLLVGASGGTHGDNAEMVAARRAFLGGGYYSPLCERVSELADALTPEGGAVLDVGCGEGYYTSSVAERLRRVGGCREVLAFDISKEAVKRLATLDKGINAAVASAYDIPIADASVDTALLIFSPLAKDEIYRVLKHGASFIMVFPDEEHLFGLKSAIYKTPYKNKPEPTEIDGFTLVTDEKLAYEITVGGEMLKSLFMMTPYAYRTRSEDRERLFSNPSVTTEIAFRILHYRKN